MYMKVLSEGKSPLNTLYWVMKGYIYWYGITTIRTFEGIYPSYFIGKSEFSV